MKLSNSQLNKLKSRVKNGTGIILNVIGDFNDETNFPPNLLLTDTQLKIHEAF